MTTWAFFALTVLGWGMGAFIMKIAARHVDSWTAIVFALPGYLLIGLLLLPRLKWSGFSWNAGHAAAMAVGISYSIGNWAFYRMAETQPIALITPMTGLYIAVPVFLGVFLLGERPTPAQCLGILLACVALVLLAWPSGPNTD
jgi:drug/metabolite transporter (DMT)-like permease